MFRNIGPLKRIAAKLRLDGSKLLAVSRVAESLRYVKAMYMSIHRTRMNFR
jgi:hypothetical protein